ncbi:phage portal protein [Edwardsiella tarda]|uniref:phage portal protein n=1 Tax=Edwardsiella tarda TaxID=636 RepID=UPI00266FDAEB|nr:phage portal protein [Edwardsiella tarda]WKS80406.1 phage portal protein [Edwardsiella tarda]
MFWKKKEKPDKQIRKIQTGNTTLKNQINNTLRSGGVIGTGTDNINNLIHNQLRNLVSTSRKLALDNCIAKRYITAAADGVVGDGIYIRPHIDIYGPDKNQTLSREIEKRFYQYADDRELFSINGRLSLSSFQRLIEKTRATDGECFIRIHRENGLQFEIVDSLRVPSSTVPQMLENGNYISNGIEFNQYGKPQAYYVAPLNISTMQYGYQQCERVPATDMLHYFIPQQADQQRGLPDLLPCIDLIGSLEEFLNAAIIAKKIAASAMAFITNAPSNREYDEQEIIYQQTSLDPGSIVELREGQDLRTVNPQASTDGISDFINQQMQMISMALNMSQQTLTGDTANASFSASKLAERVQMNTFKTRQSELISAVLKPIYIEFCKREFINMDVQISKFNDLINADYVPQRAISIDPLKDLQTEVLALQNGLKSRAMIIAEQGYDPASVLADINREGESDNKNKDISNEKNSGESESNQID